VRTPHRFYSFDYDAVLQHPESRFEVWRRLYGGALLLGLLLPRARGVIYVAGAGFLDGADERAGEFAFIRARRRAIVCWYTGSDIRSTFLMKERERATGVANIGSILFDQGAPFDEASYDDTRRQRAEVSDLYADVIVTARVDQLSYITSETQPFLYFHPDEEFIETTTKFDHDGPLIILHAPSNPIVKGTATIRDVMGRICDREGGRVVYRELTGVGNTEVLAALDEAHVVVNQIYAQMPSVFGIEAMARRCVLVCSADPRIETDLEEAAGAWVVATASSLEAELTALIANRAALAELADRGWHWARAHASASASAAKLADVLDRAYASARRLA
jgi:hypothetical protein